MRNDERLDEWVTTAEAADIAGCSYAAIMKRIYRDRIVAKRLGPGAVWIVLRSSVVPKGKFQTHGRTAEGRTSTAR